MRRDAQEFLDPVVNMREHEIAAELVRLCPGDFA
jgi:hypothetical protein